jgi:hypothetical protein
MNTGRHRALKVFGVRACRNRRRIGSFDVRGVGMPSCSSEAWSVED